MSGKRVLVTCPPMLGMQDHFKPRFVAAGVEMVCPKVVQTLSEAELIDMLPAFDGWIIGDDPATEAVFKAGHGGRLRAAVKWGIGVDNVDQPAARALGIAITNTPMMFGAEVADVAMAYVTMLARQLRVIDAGVREGGWPKPRGMSLAGKTVGLIGLGDIGRNFATRALAAGLRVIAWDPMASPDSLVVPVELARWPERIEECHFLVFTCALTASSKKMLNADTLALARKGLRVVNVARGGLIDEPALVAAVESGHVHSVALDVFDIEPLPMDSPLRLRPESIFGSHNGSNTEDAVIRASDRAISLLFEQMSIQG